MRKRWKNLVRTDDGLDRRFYELCVLSELKNALRSGDIWVQDSRQFKDFVDYLLSPPRFAAQRDQRDLVLAIETDCDRFLESRLAVLQEQLATVERLTAANELPDAAIPGTGRLKITPLVNAVPDEAEALMQQAYSLLPHLKITELLLEVDGWSSFSRHFKHLKSGATAEDQQQLLTAIVADAINLGLSKMAEPCSGTTYAKLTWLQAWHIRDETYSAGLAELVNAQFRQPFASYWGDGTTSSSDGQYFKAGGRAGEPEIWPGAERAVLYSPVRPVFAVPHQGHQRHGEGRHPRPGRAAVPRVRPADRRALHRLGFRFAPRIRAPGDTKLCISKGDATYEALKPMIGGTLNIKHVRAHWDDIRGWPPRFGRARSRPPRCSGSSAATRASGLNPVTAAIVLFYLERAANALRGHGHAVDDALLQYLSPLGWEHIDLTGDYVWCSSAKIGEKKFRPLRPLQSA